MTGAAVVQAEAQTRTRLDTERVADLRGRVRAAMERPPVRWDCPPRIDDRCMEEPLPVRKARAIEVKLSQMPPPFFAITMPVNR